MANPALLLVKPLLKAIGKEAVKIIGKQAAKAGVSAGLTAASKGALTALDAVNIARSAIDKTILPSVAKSLGMTTKELKQITQAIKMTDARKKAVQGKNFIRNVNRFVETPQTSIKQYLKRELKKQVRKGVQDQIKETTQDKTKNFASRNALKLLEGKLKAVNPTLKIPATVWAQVDELDVDTIFEVMEYLEIDFYYTANNSEPDNPIYLDKEHKGFRQGMEEADFVDMIESMLLNGFHSTPIDGII